ncbi:hypothetical protein [Clostridium scatologenes]|uniref:Uncharacterized protein n=1 Tax=Clostridium scatologenes TaxID=1548 RepID=A0A0E3GRE0_CLOSL|nr:hypothetical protein [Clostridium scatologenes]AKA70156.1 hypothetical protein CSCA_3031 [Clostridium scatologenes]
MEDKKVIFEIINENNDTRWEEVKSESFKYFIVNQLKVNNTFNFYNDKYIVKDKYDFESYNEKILNVRIEKIIKNEERIYSFNKAVFVIAMTNTPYEMGVDEFNGDTYFTFPNSLEVRKALRVFSKSECVCYDFHKFLGLFKDIRKESIKLKEKESLAKIDNPDIKNIKKLALKVFG